MKNRRPSLGVIAAAVWGLLLAAGAWAWHLERAAAATAGARLAGLGAEAERLRAIMPPLDPAGETAVAEAIAAHERQLRALRSTWTEELTVGEPAAAIDAWFELSRAVEDLQERAAGAGVHITPEERFGFASCFREGAAEIDLATAVMQARITGALTRALIDARPRAIVAVQREAPAGAAPADSTDFFRWEEARSLRAGGVLDATAFRLEFTGGTDVLRRFLGAVATQRLPLAVRSVEVSPFREESDGIGPASESRSGRVLVVEPGWSRFVIVIEHLRLAAEAS